MKILKAHKFFHIVGGSERYYFDLINLLSAHGHQIIPFSMLDKRNKETPYKDYFVSHLDYNQSSLRYFLKNGPKIVGKTIYSFESKRKIGRLIQDTQPDIAHIHMVDHQISPSILDALKKRNIPMVQTLHEYKLICPNYRLFIERKKEICERCKGGKFYNTVIHKCLKDSSIKSFLACIAMYIHKFLKIYEKNVDTFHVPSQFMRDKMIEFGIDPDKLTYLPHMVDTERFRPRSSHSHYILYFGRLAKEKGLFTLMEVMKKFPNVKLVIVGRGELESDLMKYAEKHDLDNVKLMGYKSGQSLVTFIQEAQFVVVPSLWYEAFGLTIVESFACAKPVIGADIGGVSELISQENGLLFQPGNSDELAEKIAYFLSHPSLVKELGMKARKYVEDNFSPEQHYRKTMDLYHKVLSKR